MDTAAVVIANLDAGRLVAAAFLAGILWAGFTWLIVGIIHSAAKSDQVSRTNFAAQDAVRTAEQIVVEASTAQPAPKKVLADARWPSTKGEPRTVRPVLGSTRAMEGYGCGRQQDDQVHRRALGVQRARAT